MEKTINIGDKEVRLTNNVGWMMTYRDQFGTDIVMSLTPLIASGLDIVSGLVDEATDGDIFDTKKLLAALDGDTLIDALSHLSGFEMVDLIKITWAMAKEADDSIPEPKTWVRSFEEFPIDVVVPEIIGLAFKGMCSSKNLERLRTISDSMAKKPQPKKKRKAT